MDWNDIDTTHCGVAACAEVLQDRWAILILRDLLAGITRYGDLQRHTGASTAILANRLRDFIAAGIIQEQTYAVKGQRRRNEYVVTPKGLSLSIVLGAMAQFGYDQLPEGEKPLVQFFDTQTNQKVRVGLVREDGQPIGPSQVRVELDPTAYSPEFCAPSSRQRKN